jgi:hypothetical protein
MAKLSGPLFSLAARGALGKSLIFSKVGKTPYVKKNFSPANPQSAKQSTTRFFAKWITQLWSQIDQSYKANFYEMADQMQLSPYHAFIGFNMRRWADGLMPSLIPDDSEDVNFSIEDQSVIINGRQHCFRLDTNGARFALWKMSIHATHDGFELPTKENVVAFSNDYIYLEFGDGYFAAVWIAPDDRNYQFSLRPIQHNGANFLFGTIL